jgi:hypothetical protein
MAKQPIVRRPSATKSEVSATLAAAAPEPVAPVAAAPESSAPATTAAAIRQRVSTKRAAARAARATKAVATPVAPEVEAPEAPEPVAPELTPEPPTVEPEVEPTVEPVAPEPVAPEPTETEPAGAIEAAQPVLPLAPPLPALDQAPTNADQPMFSYKPPFKFLAADGGPESWMVSGDGGKTNAVAGTKVVGGSPYDLNVDITPSTRVEGTDDYRLRLSFIDQGGFLVELNLNGINPKRNHPGEWVMSNPTRSLLGALLAISENGDDIDGFARGARFELKAGTRGALFVDVAIVYDDRNGVPQWSNVSSPAATKSITSSIHGLLNAVSLIKERLRAENVLQPTPAIRGEGTSEAQLGSQQEITVVAVDATTIIEG